LELYVKVLLLGMKLIKGRKIADGILADLKKRIKKEKLVPGLAVILVGENKASRIYVKLKEKAALKIGVNFSFFKFEKNAFQNLIISKIKELNKDEKIHGILVQLPLPAKFNTRKIINLVDYRKDVDGFNPINLKLFNQGKEIISPVFPKAIIKILGLVREIKKNDKALVITKSHDFGRVMLLTLKKIRLKGDYMLVKGNKGIKGSKGDNKIKKADIIITACGVPGFIKGEMIKKGAIIVDGGITKVGKKVLGDVDIESVKNIAFYVTPVPGGVGPVTVATLMENVYLASKSKRIFPKERE
jgi:methylenetetrahydrofolate dehydrogenase (NADP+) / methenyltetrahydrofolate cyclohydrolase